MPRVNANNLEFEYDEFGDPQDPAMLMIMGLGAQMVFWREELCQGLADQGFHVIRLDNRDVGLSSSFNHIKPRNIMWQVLLKSIGIKIKTAYSLDDMAKDVVSIMDALKIDKAHLVGMSMGGMITQLTCIHYPDRILTATAMMTTSLNPKTQHIDREVKMLLIKGPENPNELESVIDFTKKFFALISGPSYPVSQSEIEEIVTTSFNRNSNRTGIKRQTNAIISHDPLNKDLKKLDIPFLVLHGDADTFINVAGGKDIAKCVKNSKLVIYEGLGHWPAKKLYESFIKEITEHAKQKGNGSSP